MSYLEREAHAQYEAGISIKDIAERLRVSETRIEGILAGEWTVRVTDPLADARMLGFVDALRQMGFIRDHGMNGEVHYFDILPPGDVDSKTWANNNASYMQKLGFSATAEKLWTNTHSLEDYRQRLATIVGEKDATPVLVQRVVDRLNSKTPFGEVIYRSAKLGYDYYSYNSIVLGDGEMPNTNSGRVGADKDVTIELLGRVRTCSYTVDSSG